MIAIFIVGLQLILITLKLTGHLEWNWGAVLSPSIVVATFALTAVIIHFLRWHLDPEYRLRLLLERYAQHFGDR